MRGLSLVVEEKMEDIGLVDSGVSSAGWGLAVLIGSRGHVFHPQTRWSNSLEIAKRYGATLHPIPSSKLSIMFARAKREFTGLMLPLSLRCPESVKCTSAEAAFVKGFKTVVVSYGSGTITAGVVLGVKDCNRVISVKNGPIDTKMAKGKCRSLIGQVEPLEIWRSEKMVVVDSGIPYFSEYDSDAPFPCNKTYDTKSWHWLTLHLEELESPVLFWNIGGVY